jgi:hypothetical protein
MLENCLAQLAITEPEKVIRCQMSRSWHYKLTGEKTESAEFFDKNILGVQQSNEWYAPLKGKSEERVLLTQENIVECLKDHAEYFSNFRKYFL